MSRQQMDINDDEIRVISPSGQNKPGNNKKKILMIAAAVSVLIVLIAAVLYCIPSGKFVNADKNASVVKVSGDDDYIPAPDSVVIGKGYVEVRDTVVKGRGLTFLIPHNAVPSLIIGPEALSDTTLLLAAQAADIRADNGKIAGSFVLKGDLISKGEAKSGFCAIVNDNISIGVADASPMLEQAIENNGYFFRQYPLVVGQQLVENKPKGQYLRRALVDIDGNIGIAMSADRLSFHDFSQALIEAGVRNAIYIVGGSSSGCYRDISGNRIEFGTADELSQYTNYIVWK